MKIVKIDNLVINLEELCYFEVFDADTNCMPEERASRINFYFKNGARINTKYKPESVVECLVERICNIMQG